MTVMSKFDMIGSTDDEIRHSKAATDDEIRHPKVYNGVCSKKHRTRVSAIIAYCRHRVRRTNITRRNTISWLQ